MGILRRSDSQPQLVKIDNDDLDNFDIGDYDFNDDDDTATDADESINEIVLVNHQQQQLTRKSQRRRNKVKSPRLLEPDTLRVSKNMGARKWRRFNHDRELLSLTDPDDICHDFSDMLAPAISSAFSRLFVHHDNMQAWNEFIDKTEDVQLHILDECDHRRRRQLVSTDGGYRVGGRSPAKHHRADATYTGEACFERLNARYKSLFSDKCLPWEFIADIERELSIYFTARPDGVWMRFYERSVDRLLLHGVAQYLSLKSKSVNGTDKVRRTEVHNPKSSFFVSPRHSLIDIVRQRTAIVS